MGDTEDISSSLISTIILSTAVLELFLILVAKYTVYFGLYFFNNEASFFPVPSMILLCLRLHRLKVMP